MGSSTYEQASHRFVEGPRPKQQGIRAFQQTTLRIILKLLLTAMHRRDTNQDVFKPAEEV